MNLMKDNMYTINFILKKERVIFILEISRRNKIQIKYNSQDTN